MLAKGSKRSASKSEATVSTSKAKRQALQPEPYLPIDFVIGIKGLSGVSLESVGIINPLFV